MRHLSLGFIGSVVLLAGACGGKVVVDADSTGGGGGAGGNVSSVVSTGVVSPVGVVSVGTGGESLCDKVCSALVAQGCDINPGCVAECEQAYAVAGQCVSLLDAFSFCVINTSSPAGCNTAQECGDEAQSYQDCIGNTPPVACGDIACAGNGGGSCACKGICDNRTLGVECTPGDATDFCTCLENGVPIGKCSMPQMEKTTCDILGGCCAEVFFP